MRVGNSSPRYSENRKNNPLVLSDTVAEPDKKVKYYLYQFKSKICSSLHYNEGNDYLFINRTQICKLTGLYNLTTYLLLI